MRKCSLIIAIFVFAASCVSLSGGSVINGAKGLITPGNGAIDLYNDDGSFWYRFELVNEPSINGDKVKDPNPDFVPYAFRLEYTPVYLRVVADDWLRYEVVANEKTGLRKFVRKSPFVQFESWEQHILHTFCVVPIEPSNAVRDIPADGATPMDVPKENPMSAVEFKGEWLKVRWRANGTTTYGWVKWKEADKLLINWFYFA